MAKNNNHHLFNKNDAWYFRKRVNGKWIKKALSKNLAEARRLRDQLLKEIFVYGEIQRPRDGNEAGPLFGELAERWAKIKPSEVKESTLRDYKSAMNLYVLPRFGNCAMRDITYLDVLEFRAGLKKSAKRVNNVLGPMRSVFTMAFKEGIIKDNVMSRIDNLRIEEPTINPLSLEDAMKVVEIIHPDYRNFTTALFFTGARFGEMAGLKWHRVDLERGTARISETLVYGVEGRPKTKKSNRDIDLLPPVIEALKAQKRITFGKTEYVFLNLSGKPLTPDHFRNVIWKPALKIAGIEYRPPMQTRHTFATIMLSEGENIGWVQNMLGHSSLQMIFTKYYAWIPKKTRNDGSAFMAAYNSVDVRGNNESEGIDGDVAQENVPQMCPANEKGLTPNRCKSLNSLVAGTGFEPVTFGL